MSYPGFSHNWNCDGSHDLLDHARVRHAGNTTLGSNIGWDTLKGHNGRSTGLFSNSCLQIKMPSQH